MTFKDLEVTWRVLGDLMQELRVDSNEFSSLCEARRLVEVAMRALGFEAEWEGLRGDDD